jgi:hypothetical protein
LHVHAEDPCSRSCHVVSTTSEQLATVVSQATPLEFKMSRAGRVKVTLYG